MKRWVFAVVILSCSVLVAAGQTSPRLNVVDGVVLVTGLEPVSTISATSEERWRAMFSVYTDEAFMKRIDQPVAGKYLWNKDGFSFEPTYPFSAGAVYHAVLLTDADSNFIGNSEQAAARKVDFTFKIPTTNVSLTAIEAVYPASAVLPENLLRMYIIFSGPMMPGEAYKHIALVNEKGERVERPFLIVDQELWDTSRTRFTLLFDPGRIKRGLKSNLDMGPPLRDGERYSLLIDSTWRDANGNNLQGSVVKTFRAGAPVRSRLSVDDLKVIAPPAATRGPLVIRFDRPMDRTLVVKYITIQDSSANTIRGEFGLDNDTVLKFTPDVPWAAGDYTVVLAPLMEDVAGNSFRNAFDVDLLVDRRSSDEVAVSVRFAVLEVAR